MRAGLPRDYSGVAPDRGDQSAVDDWWFTVWLSRQLTLQVRPHARRVRLLRPLLPLFSYEPDNQLKMSRQPIGVPSFVSAFSLKLLSFSSPHGSWSKSATLLDPNVSCGLSRMAFCKARWVSSSTGSCSRP